MQQEASGYLRRMVSMILAIGGISFVAGYVAPIFLSKSNTGPLLGVFVTGPLGAIIGSAIAVIREANTAPREPLLAFVGFGGFGSLLYALLLIAMQPRLGLGIIPVLAVGAAAAALVDRRVVFFVTSLIVATIVYLPVDRAPHLVFFRDLRLQALKEHPLLLLDSTRLLLEWLIILAIGAVAITLTRRSRLRAA